MIKYSILLTKVIKKKIDYFSLDALQKAKLFYDCELYIWAGKIYFENKEYELALDSFLKCKDGEGIVYSYAKLGQVSEAIEMAVEYNLYGLAGSLCEKSGDYSRAAFFFSHNTPVKAATFYVKAEMHYEAGMCYLDGQKLDLAFIEFNQCTDSAQLRQGLLYIEEMAVVLYLDKKYMEAYKLFCKLELFDSALICAYEMNNKKLIRECERMLKQIS
ncbi:MAG: hypothetical protein ATN31_10620 [Candidatus Epulonipiscioides saccharophilum]|nr:MAG: hypothetical protein ATN31_10620 [Epulopiscium sp. AS2M-Bin001]